MKIYIFADMEGISGVSGTEFVGMDQRLYGEGRKYYTWDINACARGCFNAGATEVFVRDGHSCGRHAVWDALDSRIEIIQGATEPGKRLPGIEGSAALILLGYHARAGQAGALLEHTYSSGSIQNMWLNGRLAGEFAFDAAIAGEYGVPTVMVSGDNKICEEALEWVPNIITCQVKTAHTCQGARLLSMEKAHGLIEERAAEAVRSIGKIKPLTVSKPVVVRKELVERGAIPAKKGITVVDSRTGEIKTDSVEEALFAF